MHTPDWQWNEMQQVGTDYTDVAEIAAYDERMATFRDVEAENREMLDMLALAPGAAVLEIGCGTGRFVRAAAKTGYAAAAIDVSAKMLEYLGGRTKEEGLPDIRLQHAGFLTMDFPEASFDAVVSGAALHHLPDAWKLAALRNIARVLKSGGKFILRDVVFVLKENESPEACFERFTSSFPNMRAEAARHAAQEFSTYEWIMDGLLGQAGFKILSKTMPMENFIVYLCGKGPLGKA